MSKQGMFRRIVDTARKAMGMPVTHFHPDPVMIDPALYRKPARHRVRKDRKVKPTAMPPCDPGTITYHDKLVKHFGRQRAEGYRIARQLGHMSCLPSEQDFADNPPWAYLK